MFRAIMLAMAVNQTLILNISTFLPIYALQNHPGVSALQIGIIIG